ncbi:MAG: serine hydrolase, partial [Vicinamibacterales bacterium]|nr:serine hydrolase [Vicinamibacterales bacterium]
MATRDDRRRSVLRRAARAVACTCLLLLAVSRPVSADIDHTRLRRIATLVEDAIQAGRIPGAVVLVGHQGEIVYERAFGARAVDDVVEPMTVDTVFDLASLTKAVATTTSVMVLLEEGRLRLRDLVVDHIPEFASHDKGTITVQHLLTHVSGLRPDLPLADVFEGAAVAIARTADEIPEAAPGERFIYSDLNFMLLAEIVRRVSGQTLDHFSRDRIFEPLGMRDTLFTPPLALVPRIAPTEACAPLAWPCGGPGASMLRGQVHDPTARRMGGVAGHAGLFSTAGDLARFSLMLLGGGAYDGIRVLAPHTVARMTQVSTPRQLVDRRGLGWDIDSRYSSNRGDLFSVGSFGHTGFTGTSLWLDPRSDTFVVFLSSRLHPSGQGDVTALRGQVATVVAAS